MTHSKVLFVDQTSALGGAELSLLDIVKERGLKDRVLLFQHGDLEEMLVDLDADVVVNEYSPEALQVRKDSGLMGALGAGAFLKSQVRAVITSARDCHVLYANTPKAFIVSAVASLICRKPVIYHLRDIVSPDHFSFFNRQAIVRLARLSRATVIANSLATARAFVKAGGSNSAVSVIYNGIDTREVDQSFEHREETRVRFRSSLGQSVHADTPLIGVLGRLAQWKGQDVALRALTELPDVHMLLVGSALFGEDDYVEKLKRLVVELHLEPRVHFLGFRRDVADIMQACDVIVHCSSSPEPFGRVIVEAMLARRPLIAARAGGAVEIIHDGQTGTLFEPGNATDLAACITRVLNDGSQQAMIESAAVDARERFSVPGQVAEVSHLVDRVRQAGLRRVLPIRPSNMPLTRTLFVDQTAQLGGAELCLLDMVLVRRKLRQDIEEKRQSPLPDNKDRVILLQHGKLEELLKAGQIDVRAESLGSISQSLHKESGLFRKMLGGMDVLKLARKVARQAHDMDLIYANTPKALVVAAMAGVLARKRVVYHLHDILSREHFSRSNIWILVGLANRYTAHVIANSQATLDVFRKVGGQTPASVCYNGFDSSIFQTKPLQQEQLARQLRLGLEIDIGARVLGVFGRLAPWKGQHVAIDALRQLPGVHLALIGDALFGEDDYKRQLLQQATQVGLAGRVHFMGFRGDVPELMQAVDAVVHCSTAPEPFGRVIVEAMLSRRPVVASRAGGVKEIIEDGVTGWLAEPGDATSLASCLKRPVDAGMLEAAYERAVEKFELNTVVREIESVLRSVRGFWGD